MYKSVIFVDFENLQNINKNLIDSKTKIIVMVGLGQDNKAFEFAKDIFNNISAIELIKVNGRGKNALDFFIAFYLGKYFDNIKGAEIIIYSKDTGYNPLIKHLDDYGLSIKREYSTKNANKKVNENNDLKQKNIKPKEEIEKYNVQTILDYLRGQTESEKNKRPKKITTLENYLHSHFSQKISIDIIKEAINIMKKKNKIIITNNKISYKSI